MEQLIGKCYDYLNQRNIPPQDYDKYGLTFTKGAGIAEALGYDGGRWYGHAQDEGILIPLFDARGSFEQYVVRVLRVDKKPTGFGEVAAVEPEKQKKLLACAGSYTHPYFAPCIDWGALPMGSKVYLCESAIKAINLVQLGYYAVGINGMDSFSAMKKDHLIIPELQALPWEASGLELIYFVDSNESKEENEGSKYRLSKFMNRALSFRSVWHLPLPQGPVEEGEERNDWGLDDAIMHHGEQWMRDLLADSAGYTLIPVDDTDEIMAQFEQYRYITEGDRVAVAGKKRLTKMGAFKNLTAHIKLVYMQEGKKTPTVKEGWKVWLESEECIKLDAAMYHPGFGDKFEYEGYSFHNTWTGWKAEPVAGDCSVVLDWFDRAFPVLEQREWLLCWMAYVFQNPDKHQFTVPVIIGLPGVGKGTIFDKFLRLVAGGDNHVTLSPKQYTGRFKASVADRVFMVVDEATPEGSERDKRTAAKAFTEVLKRETGTDVVTVEYKGIDLTTVPNFNNVIMVANTTEGVDVQDGDRRLAVLHVEIPIELMRDDRSYRDGLHRAVESVAVQNAWLERMLGWDLSAFDPNGWAVETSYKEEIRDANMEEWQRTLIDSVGDPDLMWEKWPELRVVNNQEITERLWQMKGESLPVKQWFTSAVREAIPYLRVEEGRFKISSVDRQARPWFWVRGGAGEAITSVPKPNLGTYKRAAAISNRKKVGKLDLTGVELGTQKY